MSADARMRIRHIAALARLEMRLDALRADHNELVRAAVNASRPQTPGEGTAADGRPREAR